MLVRLIRGSCNAKGGCGAGSAVHGEGARVVVRTSGSGGT